MNVATTPAVGFQHPKPLATVTPKPAFDLERDAVELDFADVPRDIEEGGILLPIKSTAIDENGFPVEGWYASASDMDPTFRMTRDGFAAAVAGAQALSKGSEAVAVVQDASSGTRYLVPLGVWDSNDESELRFEDAGGVPHYTSAKDHVLLGRNRGTADVEAVVFEGGTTWMNLTGHAVKLPTGG